MALAEPSACKMETIKLEVVDAASEDGNSCSSYPEEPGILQLIDQLEDIVDQLISW
jgi:hypothetical protein